jgi:hypothetical protein
MTGCTGTLCRAGGRLSYQATAAGTVRRPKLLDLDGVKQRDLASLFRGPPQETKLRGSLDAVGDEPNGGRENEAMPLTVSPSKMASIRRCRKLGIGKHGIAGRRGSGTVVNMPIRLGPCARTQTVFQVEAPTDCAEELPMRPDRG